MSPRGPGSPELWSRPSSGTCRAPRSRPRPGVLGPAAYLAYGMDKRARLLRPSRTRQLGVMFQVHDAFHADLVHGLYLAAEAAGYELVLSAVIPERTEEQAINALLDNRCESLLLIAPQMIDGDLAALNSRCPIVVLARPT